MQSFNMIKVARKLLVDKVKLANVIMDATCGNGFDTLFLAENADANSKIFAFDIQSEAIKSSKILLAENKLSDKVTWICDNHINFEQYVSNKIDIVVLNLGYLPSGDKNCTTTATTTSILLEKLILNLNVGGVIAITAYPGHSEGQAENIKLREFLQKLSSKVFTVGIFKMLNHSDKAPVFYILEKVRSDFI